MICLAKLLRRNKLQNEKDRKLNRKFSRRERKNDEVLKNVFSRRERKNDEVLKNVQGLQSGRDWLIKWKQFAQKV